MVEIAPTAVPAASRPARDPGATIGNRPDESATTLPLSTLKPAITAATLLVVALGILREVVIAAIGTQTVLQDLRHIALDAEHTLPSWYSSALMLLAAMFLFASGLHGRRRAATEHRFWFVLATVFLLFSIDEAVSFHEVAIKPLRALLHSSGVFYFAWVIPGGIFVAIFGLKSLPFLASLPSRLARRFTVAGLVYVSGALGMELVGGHFVSSQGWDSLAYIASATVEESLEMVGLTMFLHALLDHLREAGGLWRIS